LRVLLGPSSDVKMARQGATCLESRAIDQVGQIVYVFAATPGTPTPAGAEPGYVL
jgi:hypothetical protein